MSGEPVTLNVRERVAFIALNCPPVNSLALAVRAGLVDTFTRIGADPGIDGAVLYGLGKGFSAGGDLREFSTPDASAAPGLSADVQPALEFCGKTVVAAIHGFALGGGLETAMACHRRIATPHASLGLPEAKIKVVPLSGTQRLPRLIGLAPAIDMILSGEPVEAAKAPRGLLDAMVDEHVLLETAAALARTPAARLVRDKVFPSEGAKTLIENARRRVEAGAYAPFALILLDAIEAGVDVDFNEGLRRARAIHAAALEGPDGKRARAAFLARGNTRTKT